MASVGWARAMIAGRLGSIPGPATPKTCKTVLRPVQTCARGNGPLQTTRDTPKGAQKPSKIKLNWVMQLLDQLSKTKTLKKENFLWKQGFSYI